MAAHLATLPTGVREWAARGHGEEVGGYRIHCFYQPGEGPLLVLLHGFPTCSYDWRDLVERLPGRAILAFDFLGFGLSDKPRDHEYALAWQADLVEELVERHGGGPVELVAHDMGTSVANELMARDLEDRLGLELSAAVLFNGSMIIERASLTPGQKLLRSRLGPLFARLSTGRFFRQQLGSVFGAAHPLDPQEAEDQWELMRFHNGHRIADKLIVYTFERVRHAERWHGAIRDWPGPLTFLWGLQDPVATTNVLAGLRDLRPAAPVTEIPDLAHYPQVEDPDALLAALSKALPSR